MCEVTPKPDGFTKWDKTVVVGTTETSLNEFFALFKAKTDLNITMLFHPCANADGKPWSGRLLYNNYDEDESADHRDRPLLAYMGELYDGEGWPVRSGGGLWAALRLTHCCGGVLRCAGANILPETSTCVALEVSCANDDNESYVVPQLVFKFA